MEVIGVWSTMGVPAHVLVLLSWGAAGMDCA